jgi:hypothetical protein
MQTVFNQAQLCQTGFANTLEAAVLNFLRKRPDHNGVLNVVRIKSEALNETGSSTSRRSVEKVLTYASLLSGESLAVGTEPHAGFSVRCLAHTSATLLSASSSPGMIAQLWVSI